ncbi:hypothetical protein CFC21_099040 [Triticum aestivum]|uniref:Uncharacterized protein n=2 Tax=Triticum aestivum TaxID=4565 RepID=A0A9R1LY30_WHEAT|nr:hypothetical protein CFC21_099039 [Triticum aestivum]KAF7097191.1 hypothetical protein CFC21_099040 [Triticum aestivum]
MEKAASFSTEKAAAPASHPWLRFDLYVEGYPIKKQKMVKLDHRNSYIKWLLVWDKKPRRPLPNFPERLRKVTDAIKAERDENERVLADFKRDGYAYVQVDVFNDDDPRANLPDHHYDIIHHDSDDDQGEQAEHILGRL